MESNSLLPYEIIKENEWNYSFITKHGIIYHAYFIDFSNYHPLFEHVSTSDDDYILYVSIYIRKDNSQLHELVAAFYDLVKNDFYPID